MRYVGIGVLGCGRIGQLHAEIVAQRTMNASLTAVADAIEGLASKVASEVGAKHSYVSLKEMVKDPEVDAVILATPTFMHKDNIIEAAEAQKHILCEKPITLTIEEANFAISTAKKADVKLQVGYMRRFDPSYQKANLMIERAEIGKPVIFKGIARDPSPPPAGWEADPKLSGGMFATQTSHDFDLARWLMKSEVVSVSAEGGALTSDQCRKYNDLDNAVVNLRFASGAVGNIENSRNFRYGYDQRVELVGSEGAVFIENWRPDSAVLYTEDGLSLGEAPWFLGRFKEAFVAQANRFVECIIQDKEPYVTGYDGLKALEIAMAAWKSLEQKKFITI